MNDTLRSPSIELWARIFFPEIYEKTEMLRTTNRRLVHYTSLEVACSIFQNKRFWMRNAAVMNDYSEIRWGEHCLERARTAAAGERLRHAMDEAHPGVNERVLAESDEWRGDLRSKTYLASFAIHEDIEDTWGRLSMWRAYGNVAIVFNSSAFVSAGSPLMPTSIPVTYVDPDEIVGHLDSIAAQVEQSSRYVATLNPHHVRDIIFRLMRNIMLSSKHPGFHEEKEWRIIFTEGLDQSGFLERKLTVVNGIPQSIYMVPMVDSTECAITGNTVRDHVNRGIIGPCKHPETARRAIIEHLEDCGVQDASNRVVVSALPLRD